MNRTKIIMKSNIGRNKYYVLCVTLLSLSFGFSINTSLAEQSGSSPDSGVSKSVLSTGYDFLVSKGSTYGSSSSPDWTYNWGAYWNRIMYSATWEPDGTATEYDVSNGKIFYSSSSRILKSGTGIEIGYSLDKFVQYDDGHASDYTGEESSWINTNSSSGSEVWYDTRTGVYWARSEPTTLSNSFTISSCDFYHTGTYPTRGSYGTSGTDPNCGNAINACAVLSLASNEGGSADTDWYLPSQKELQRAYYNGIYNKTSANFTTAVSFWSSTERSDVSTIGWYVFLNYGGTYSSFPKSTAVTVRCVRRG